MSRREERDAARRRRDNPAEDGFDNKDNAPWPGFVVINAVQLGVEKNALLSPLKCCNLAKTGCPDGLKKGDRVMTSGQFLLQPGSIVSIDPGSGT
jgi:hypothetical protein